MIDSLVSFFYFFLYICFTKQQRKNKELESERASSSHMTTLEELVEVMALKIPKSKSCKFQKEKSFVRKIKNIAELRVLMEQVNLRYDNNG